ncbi:RodZ domain-containing protein [Aliamphritea spongicola]|nr:RodZ domain-containing protein [Aliamphritea spongicola]
MDPVSVPVTEKADEVLASAEAVLEQAAETVQGVTADSAQPVEETTETATEQPVAEAEPLTSITAQTDIELETAQVEPPVLAPVQEASQPDASDSGIGRLLIDFIDDCWISVKDVNGQVLAMRIKPAGSRLDVSGPGPLKIQIGKVSAVKNITFNGQTVDLSSYTRLDVAKLNLPASE